MNHAGSSAHAVTSQTPQLSGHASAASSLSALLTRHRFAGLSRTQAQSLRTASFAFVHESESRHSHAGATVVGAGASVGSTEGSGASVGLTEGSGALVGLNEGAGASVGSAVGPAAKTHVLQEDPSSTISSPNWHQHWPVPSLGRLAKSASGHARWTSDTQSAGDVALPAYLRRATTEYPRRSCGAAATRLRGLSTSRPRRRYLRGISTSSRPRRRRDSSPLNIHAAAAAPPRLGISTSSRPPRRRRDSSPLNIHVPAAAPPRLIFTQYPRRSRGAAATHLRNIRVAAAASPRLIKGRSARGKRTPRRPCSHC